MEHPEEILHSLEEFSKLKPKDIPRELEEYLWFVAKTGDPVYQWSAVKTLFREKLVNVITDFYETCPSVEIPPCPNVEMFNYDSMKNFILEKLDTFAAAPFTVQRICELLTTPRKEYNRIDKYMRALEKNILVVSTTEPGNRRNTENGEGIMNGIESEHVAEGNSNNDINVEEMDDTPAWPRINQADSTTVQTAERVNVVSENASTESPQEIAFVSESHSSQEPSTSAETVICRSTEQSFVSIEPVAAESCGRSEDINESNVSVTITAIPAPVQKRRDSIEPIVPSEEDVKSAVKSEIESDALQISTNDNTESDVQLDVEKTNRLTVSEESELKTSDKTESTPVEHKAVEIQIEKFELIKDSTDETVITEETVETNIIVKDEESIDLLIKDKHIVPSTDIPSETKIPEDEPNKNECPDLDRNKQVPVSEIKDEITVQCDETETVPKSSTEQSFEVIEETVDDIDNKTSTITEPQSSDLDVVQDLPSSFIKNSNENTYEETPMEVDFEPDNNTETATALPNELDTV